ncbi:MAG: response regulator [Ignavibacteriae bacterium]|nr:response regulator [Ignavibacteriota bacterium]
MQVLIVDDSKVFRSRLVELLSTNNKSNKIVEAGNIIEAQEILVEYSPDLLITDIRMQGGSGFDLIKELDGKSQDMTKVVITNYTEEQYRKKALNSGADYFIDKSHDMEKLLQLYDSFS